MRYYLIIGLLTVCSLSVAQNIKLSIEVGVGTYHLNGLKAINDAVKSDLPINGKLVENFPATFYYRPSVSLKYKKVAWGFTHSYMSTGSRISTRDYSGEYRFDMIVAGHAPALHVDVFMSQNKKINTYLRLLAGLSFSHLNVEEYFQFNGGVMTNEKMKFKSTNYFVEPAFYFTLPMRSFLLESHVGYSMFMGDNTLQDSSGDMQLANPENGNSILPNWSGIRIGVGISYVFGSKED